MIVRAFLRWAETAGATDRARAAQALVKAFSKLSFDDTQRLAAVHAMMHLLDDPSPNVRRALSEAIAPVASAPRALILALAEDQPEIACPVLTLSPVLSEADLVDLVGRGSNLTRGLIAARPVVTRGVAAAIAEVGDQGEILLLLENRQALLTRYSLKRISERHGRVADIRNLLLVRTDLPAEARDLLVHHVSSALALSPLVQSTLSAARISHVTRQAGNAATIALAGQALPEEMPALVAHLRDAGRLTPAFLMHALCSGRIEFFAAAMTDLSGLEDRRVRSIMATGRRHAVRALYESAGLGRDVADVFVEATMLWREMMSHAYVSSADSICAPLMQRFARSAEPFSPVNELLDMVETLHHSEERQLARSFADQAAIAA
ncbi:DUF2336 domain-containing protein [Rhizobium sp. FY34]|uniref:DUF2336 domain-containing protein n=1 Tax=Rhizobium sp. FY34 TaxID=2562309 RepID=UPI0010C10843|nr:DUF2336 domain-containing protein [Rhizobium sp. FY34]